MHLINGVPITPLGFALAQNVENKQAELKTPHFSSLSQDMVASSKKQKCGLKYVMQTPRKKTVTFDNSD